MEISNKVIVLVHDPKIHDVIQHTIEQHHLIIEKQEPLHSLDAVLREIENQKSTLFLRSAFNNFIKHHGAPLFIVLEFPAPFLEQKQILLQKVLYTFLISYMILVRNSELAHIRGNFFLIVPHHIVSTFQHIIQKPELIIAQLKTKDEKVNQIIASYGNQKMFQSLFFIKPYDASEMSSLSVELSYFIDAVKKRQSLIQKLIEKKRFTVSKHKDAAKVIVRISKDKIAVDREIIVSNDATYDAYLEGHIYVVGDWTNIHSRKVAGKIISIIKDGVPGWKISTDEPIFLHLEEATIDHTTAATLAQMIFNELGNYASIKIYCNDKNSKILEGSEGFSMIKKYIVYRKT